MSELSSKDPQKHALDSIMSYSNAFGIVSDKINSSLLGIQPYAKDILNRYLDEYEKNIIKLSDSFAKISDQYKEIADTKKSSHHLQRPSPSHLEKSIFLHNFNAIADAAQANTNQLNKAIQALNAIETKLTQIKDDLSEKTASHQTDRKDRYKAFREAFFKKYDEELRISLTSRKDDISSFSPLSSSSISAPQRSLPNKLISSDNSGTLSHRELRHPNTSNILSTPRSSGGSSSTSNSSTPSWYLDLLLERGEELLVRLEKEALNELNKSRRVVTPTRTDNSSRYSISPADSINSSSSSSSNNRKHKRT